MVAISMNELSANEVKDLAHVLIGKKNSSIATPTRTKVKDRVHSGN